MEEDFLKKRQITLVDGRYLIFFTFNEEETAPAETGSDVRQSGSTVSSENDEVGDV